MEIDWIILDEIQKIFGCDFMDTVMPKITILGDAGILWVVIGLCLLVSKKHRKAGIFVLSGLLLGLIIGNGVVKNLVARQRPCWINEDIKLLIVNPKDYSFPSGHTQASAIAATVLTLYKKKWEFIVSFSSIDCFFNALFVCAFSTVMLGGADYGNHDRSCYSFCGK